MKYIVFLTMLMVIAYTTQAEPAEPNPEDILTLYGEEQQFRAASDNENSQNAPSLSLNDVYLKHVKEWSEQSFVRAINSLGILKMPGLKLVKLPKSMINVMKRRPTRTFVRPLTYVRPESKVEYDVVPSQCTEVLQDMYALAHADSRLAYKVQTMKCLGGCSNGKVCILKKKSMIVYLIGSDKQLSPNTIDVGCSCGCM